MEKYAVGDWYHLFETGNKETRCRIVIDLEQSKLIAAQEWTGLKFEDVLGDRFKHLAESVIEVNQAHAKVEEWAPDPEFANELPEWVSPRNLSNYIEHPPAFFDSTGALRSWETADPLPSDWTGIAKRKETLFVIGKEGGEMSYTALQAKTMAEARDEISQRKLSNYIERQPQVQYVIRSLSESDIERDGDAGAFWSNVDGWGSFQAATLFSTKERMSLNLPMSAKLDAEWMLEEEARDLEANRNLSNYIEQSTQETPAAPGPKLYRAEVHGGSDLDVSPSVAVFQVDEQLARDIIKFASLVKANDVSKIERFDYRAEFFQFDPETAPEDAAQAGEDNSVRTECDCLVVTDSEFFFRAYVKHTDVGVECRGQSVSELAKHFGLQFGELEAQQSAVDKGLLLRNKALALLQEAQAVDDLKPFTVTHTHSFGESTYVLWAAEKPTLEEAEAVLDSEFEPDREETLSVEDCYSLEEMSGVAVTARLPDILESLQSPGQDDSPSP